MHASARQAWLGSMAPVLLAGFLFFHSLGARELVSSHEARAAQNAALILDTGQWGLPRLLDEQLELQKPPLYYWLVTLTALLGGGVDAWAVRMPAALAALGCIAGIWFFLWRQGRPGVGFVAACILATCWHFTWLARVGRIDMPLTLTVTAALGCFYLGGDTWRWRAGGYFAVALGILLKGPIAAVLVAAVAGGMFMMDIGAGWRATHLCGVASRVVGSSIGWGAPLIILVAAPWFIWANIHTHGRLWNVFIVYHNYERGFGSETLAAHPWWFYAGRIWIDAFPWSLALPAAGLLAWKRGWWRDDAVCRLGLVWFLSIGVLLSLMRFKRADYLLPAFPGLALFLGSIGVRWWQEARPRWAVVTFASLLLGYAASWGVYLQLQEETWPYQTAAARIRNITGDDTPIIFFRAEVHPLAFHLRRPLGTIREWENLEVWANAPRLIYFIMPAECAREWSGHLQAGWLEPVLAVGDLLPAKHDRDLVLLCNVPVPR